MTALGLYVHWPYCARICPYCDFNVYRNRGVDADRWASALISELEYWAREIERRPLTSIYFGGGTPSLAPVSVIETVIGTCARLFGLADGVEITLEANPDDARRDRLQTLKDAGVNRLSLGVQSFRDDALAFLGRNHDSRTARIAIEAAQETFDRSTFDLIYARPDQSVADWRAELSEALAYEPSHLSLYQLTIEPGTAFAKAVAAKRWAPPDDDIQAAQFEIAQELTNAAGLLAYEVSNHARPGGESRHNLIYWRSDDYIGIGPGAHGRVTKNGERIATETCKAPAAYLAQIEKTGMGVSVTETLDENAKLVERLSMGLRLTEGIKLYANDYFYTDEKRADNLQRLIADGLLAHNCGTLRATPTGRQVLNRLLYELLI